MTKISPGILSPLREILAPDEWRARGRARRRKEIGKAQRRTSLKAMNKFCDQVDGESRIRPDHPVIVRFPIERNPEMLTELRSAVGLYQETLPADRREVLRRYYFGDFARKVAGVGSVGTEGFVLLLRGDRDDEPMFLQVKEAQQSVLSPFAGASEYEHQGERVGSGSEFDKAIAQFSVAYARQNEKDYQALVDGAAAGRGQAVMGPLTANPRPRLTGPLLPRARARPGLPSPACPPLSRRVRGLGQDLAEQLQH